MTATAATRAGLAWLSTLRRRPPDFIIGGADRPYMRRWYLIPKNTRFNIYLHHFRRSDDDRALHDHPWWNVSLLLRGGYREHMPHGVRTRYPGVPVYRRAEASHRIDLVRDEAGIEQAVWSLFITGPKVREWGFWCPKGWRHWRDFTNPADDGATVGRGCND
ncbi:MAG: hypothetical protein ACRYHQ_34280 [Janthinobacterium lividum]